MTWFYFTPNFTFNYAKLQWNTSCQSLKSFFLHAHISQFNFSYKNLLSCLFYAILLLQIELMLFTSDLNKSCFIYLFIKSISYILLYSCELRSVFKILRLSKSKACYKCFASCANKLLAVLLLFKLFLWFFIISLQCYDSYCLE